MEKSNKTNRTMRRSVSEKIEYLTRLKEEEEINLSNLKIEDKAKDGTQIGMWISTFRVLNSKGKLSEEEVNKIKELGIDLEKRKMNASDKVRYLLKLKETGIDVSQVNKVDNVNIKFFITELRNAYNNGELTKDEVEAVEDLGLDLDKREIRNMRKNVMIEYFKYLRNEGVDLVKIQNEDPTGEYAKTNKMINKFRKLYKRGMLTEEEIEQLANLGIKLSLEDRKEEKEMAQKQMNEAKELCEQYKKLLKNEKEEKTHE